MRKPIPARFSVLPENKAAAVAHLEARGYSPMAIEEDKWGLVVLIFPALPDDELFGLVRALPIHLSAKVGIMGSDHPDLTSKPDE